MKGSKVRPSELVQAQRVTYLATWVLKPWARTGWASRWWLARENLQSVGIDD